MIHLNLSDITISELIEIVEKYSKLGYDVNKDEFSTNLNSKFNVVLDFRKEEANTLHKPKALEGTSEGMNVRLNEGY